MKSQPFTGEKVTNDAQILLLIENITILAFHINIIGHHNIRNIVTTLFEHVGHAIIKKKFPNIIT